MSQDTSKGKGVECGEMANVERVRTAVAAIDAKEQTADLVRMTLRSVDEFSRVSSIRKHLGSCSVETLVSILNERHVRPVAKKKRQLLDAIMASYDWSADGVMAYVLPHGEQRVRHIQGLVENGDFECDKDLAKSDPDAFRANVVSTYPVTYLMDLTGHFVVHITEEAAKALSTLTDADWDKYAERASQCLRVRRTIPAVVDFYGVIEARDAIKRCARAMGTTLDEKTLSCLAIPDVMGEADGIGGMWYQNTYYFVSGHLTRYIMMQAGWYPDEREQVGYQVKTILGERGKKPLADLPEGLVEAGSVAALLAASEEGADLLRVLDANCPSEFDRASFAPTALAHLTRALQDSEAEQDIAEVVEGTLEFDVRFLVYYDLHERLVEVTGRYAAVVPRWKLGAHTTRVMGVGEDPARPVWLASDDLSFLDPDNYDVAEDDDGWGEPDVEGMRKRNDELLDDFWFYLRDKGVAGKTAQKHVDETFTYLDFLASYMGEPMEAGTEIVDTFLGNYFIRRCMWSSPQNISTTAESITKFYECMADYGVVGAGSVEAMKKTIDKDMEKWQETCRQYNDPSAEMPFDFFDTLLEDSRRDKRRYHERHLAS